MNSSVIRKDGLSIQVTLSSEEKLESPGSYTALIRSAVDEAIKKNASDIHFEPTESGFQIRLRICGVLKTFYSSHRDVGLRLKPEILKSSILSTLKSISNIPLGRQSEAQDSRLSLTKRGVDIRVNKIPTDYGEKIVYRLFDKNCSKKVCDLNLPLKAETDLISSTRKKAGLIIITGETGSGKTSTIYALLREMDRSGLNIVTLEDPVERRIAGVNHTSVTHKLGFSEGLRALLRQDPDVIFIGEIRDSETARLAVRAASTGHLVISTMHTNTALNIPKVFEYYGADKMQLMENLILGANQRLIRKICPKCTDQCKDCHQGFINERVLVFEYFTRNDIKENGEIQLKTNIKDLVFNLVKKGVIHESEIHRQSN